MKLPRRFSCGLCLLIGLALAAPVCAGVAGNGSRQAQTVKAQKQKAKEKKKRASPSSRKLTAQNARKSQKSQKKHQKETRPSRKTRNGADRELWLERTLGNSELGKDEILSGKASWYSNRLHGGATASGVNYDMYTFTAAHRTLPIGTVVRITDQSNGKSVMVCVTDRGPYKRGRIIDLSMAAAERLNLRERGVGQVNLEVISDANGHPLRADQAYYVRYQSVQEERKVGPFKAFADAATMHEALLRAHPDARVVLGRVE